MKHPCRTCKYHKHEKVGFRAYSGCSDDEKAKGFISDNYWYNHKCTNHEIREDCKTCQHYGKPYEVYCNSVVAFRDGKCIDYERRLQNE